MVLGDGEACGKKQPDWPNPHLLSVGPHRSEEGDPQQGADQRCLVNILCIALRPCLFLTPFSAPASNRDVVLERRMGWKSRD